MIHCHEASPLNGGRPEVVPLFLVKEPPATLMAEAAEKLISTAATLNRGKQSGHPNDINIQNMFVSPLHLRRPWLHSTRVVRANHDRGHCIQEVAHTSLRRSTLKSEDALVLSVPTSSLFGYMWT